MYVPSRYGKKSLTILTGNRKKIEINEIYSIDEDAKETLQEKIKRMLVTEASHQEIWQEADFDRAN